jgi:perosamine synthetase
MKQKILFPVSKPSITSLEKKYVRDALNSGWLSEGKYIDQFEFKFSKFCGTKYAISCFNGTVALHLAYLASELKEKDEILVPEFTFIATINAAKYIGANIKTVDLDPFDLNISIDDLKKKITSKTKAIVITNVYGNPFNIKKLKKHLPSSIKLICDASESHGSKIENKKLDRFYDMSTYSFFANKILTTGQGGMITSDNKKYIDKIFYLKNHAMKKSKKYWHDDIGYNYSMTNIQAAIGLAQLDRIDEILEKRRKIFNWYLEYFKDIKNIRTNLNHKKIQNVIWQIYVIINDIDEQKRDLIIKNLKKKFIETRPFFYPISSMPPYSNLTKNKNALEIFGKGIVLPCYFELKKNDVLYIVKKFQEAMNEVK